MTEPITQKTLARLAGVSQKTVHLALNGASGVSKATRQKVRQLAAERGYRLNAAASAMRSQATRHIGLAVRPPPRGPLTHMTAYETILGADAALAEAGYLSCLVRLTDLTPDHSSRVFNEVLLDGMIVIDQLPKAFVEPIQSIARHCVWTEANVWNPTHCIRRDELWAGELIGGHLAERGVRNIVWVGWAPTMLGSVVKTHYSFGLRLRGLHKAARRGGMTVVELPTPGMTGEELVDALVQSATRPDTAIVTYNSQTAIMVMNRLSRRRLVAGEDYSLASCDGTRREDVYLPDLARVTFDRHALGEAAGRMMLASIQGRTEECASRMVRGEWVEGATLRFVSGA